MRVDEAGILREGAGETGAERGSKWGSRETV